ncbi:ubiquitin carboxyl-terminal hydrolase 8-like isoform X2 [Littorina saxatilis]|uniref:ubiquitinyl hydrolase 1 n=1 Tax=Littorina saxatilis TaxID=31220 RepID=A0AAN9BY47_9CAEN
MPSKDRKKDLYIASSMTDLQKKSEFKLTTSNARILVKSADTMFREAERFDDMGDEEKAFIMYMRYFNIVKQVKINADYKKNKQYYDNLIGQKNQVRAIERAELLAESLKERYEFREAEGVAKKFAAMEASGKRKDSSKEDKETNKKTDSKTKGTSVDPEIPKDQPSTSTENKAQPLLNPTQLCNLLRDHSAQLILMDARSGADFAESHINHKACISVPKEVLPPGTSVTKIESQLPQESQSLWKQRGNVDHIVLLDWNSRLATLNVGTTLRTLKDAIFKYDSTVIIKSEPLVLEGGYDQWLLFYPTMTTNAKVSRPSVTNTPSSIALLDFDYPDFEESVAERPASPDIMTADPSPPYEKPTNTSGSIPKFNRALKPMTSGTAIADSIAKSSDLNNTRNLNLAARDSASGESLSMVANNLYPSVAVVKKPEKNTNIAKDKSRPPEDQTMVENATPAAPAATSSSSATVAAMSQEELDMQARLNDLEGKRKKEEKALAEIMRKKRHMEQDLRNSEKMVEEERRAKEARDKAVNEEDAERKRQTEVERLRQVRKKKEQDAAKKEKEQQDNLAREKEVKEAKERARKEEEEEEKQATRKASEQNAEKLRQEKAEKARLEAERSLTLKKQEDQAKKEEEERKRSKEEEDHRKVEEERKEAEKIEAAKKVKKAPKVEDVRTVDEGEIRHAQEPKMIPAPSLPPGWEKRLDAPTRRYYYIDHNHGKTQWVPPSTSRQRPQTGAYTAKLKDEPTVSSTRGMSRSHSSPDIVKQLADEVGGKNMPAYDRNIKPAVRSPEASISGSTSGSRTQVPRYTARRRDLNPVYGNVGPALTGLRNLGNTCYMNSTIQCLNNTTPLVTYFLNDNFQSDINRDSVQGMHGEVVDEFAVVVKALWSGQYRCITPRDLKNTVGKYNPMFAGYQQQDSQEFLTFLLDGLHEGLNEVKVRPQIPDQENDKLPDQQAAHLAWENHKRLHRSIIVELFQGQLKSTLTCRTCKKTSVTFQAFMYISLPIPSSSKCSLRDCFRAFLQPEMMTGSCKWKCPKCRVERDAEKKIDIWKLPHILLIGLNRFVSDGMWMQKKTTMVDFPVNDLDLEEFTLGPKDRARYSLYGLSNHYGTMEGGHYTAFCRNPCNSKWHKFDDHEVYEMSKSDVKTSAAFVLYYTSIPLNAPLFKPQL